MLKKVSKHQMDYVQNNCSWLPIQNRRSITGDRDALTQLLQAIDPVNIVEHEIFWMARLHIYRLIYAMA